MLHWNDDSFIHLENARRISCLTHHTSRAVLQQNTVVFHLLSSSSPFSDSSGWSPITNLPRGFSRFSSTSLEQRDKWKKGAVCSSLLLPIYIYFPSAGCSQISKGALLDILNPVQLQSVITFKQLSSNKSLIKSHQINSKRSFLLPYASEHSTY